MRGCDGGTAGPDSDLLSLCLPHGFVIPPPKEGRGGGGEECASLPLDFGLLCNSIWLSKGL